MVRQRVGFLEPHGRGRRSFRRDALSGHTAAPPVVVVHSLAQAVAALNAAAERDRALVLASAPDAGIYAGPGWWKALVEAAGEAVPRARFSAILDCGGDAGAAMAAIRAGVEAIVFTGRTDVAARLADIAAQSGLGFHTGRPAHALDLGARFFADAETLRRECADLLASWPGFC
jgi:hypothetical protein